MRILITGHKGLIGTELSKALKKHTVLGIDIKDGVDILSNINWPKVDVVFHLAANKYGEVSMSDPAYDARNNILTTLKILTEYPDTKIIFTSSIAAKYKKMAYGISKASCEDYIKLLSKNYVICRLSNIFGCDGESVIDKFKRDKEVTVYGKGNQTRDFVHVTDIVQCLIKAVKWPKGTYECGSGKNTKIIDIARKTGKKINFSYRREFDAYRPISKNSTPNWKPKIKPL